MAAGQHMADPNRLRARGALLGLAVGDALGTTLEFSHPGAPPFPALATGPQTEVTGGGPFRVIPGQVTDDTQMAVCLADSLLAVGRLDAREVASRYIAWSGYAFDIGRQTKAALRTARRQSDPRDAGKAVWIDGDRNLAGNGSLMRTAPIGVFFCLAEKERVCASLDERSSSLRPFDSSESGTGFCQGRLPIGFLGARPCPNLRGRIG